MSTSSAKARKARVGFNISKDILLLRSTVNVNPWQNGDERWIEIAKETSKAFDENVTIDTDQRRIKLLVQKYKTNELKYKSGTEVEMTERGTLIEKIIAIQAEERAANDMARSTNDVARSTNGVACSTNDVARPTNVEHCTNVESNIEHSIDVVNIEISAENSEQVLDDVEFQYINFGQYENEGEDPPPIEMSAARRKAQRTEADKERQRYVDEAIGTPSLKPKRPRLTLEDELIQQRQDHDLEIEKKRTESKLKIEKEKTDHAIKMETEKLEFEKKKAETKLEIEKEKTTIEKAREQRKEEESRRRDDMARMQLQIQSKMVEMMEKFFQK